MKQNKKFYEQPNMKVVKLKSRPSLLAGSQIEKYRNGGDIWEDDDYDK